MQELLREHSDQLLARVLLLQTDGGTERPAHLNVILNFAQVLRTALD